MDSKQRDHVRSVHAMDANKHDKKRPFYYWVSEFTQLLKGYMVKKGVRITPVFNNAQGVKLKGEWL